MKKTKALQFSTAVANSSGPFTPGIDTFVVVDAGSAGGEELDLPFDPGLVTMRIADEHKWFRTSVSRRSGRW
jgi:hypothetical protein